jgi:alkylresorcinol/alkylpyrone synthase
MMAENTISAMRKSNPDIRGIPPSSNAHSFRRRSRAGACDNGLLHTAHRRIAQLLRYKVMDPTVRLLSVATATPPHRLPQALARDSARLIFADRVRDFDRLAPVFTNSGIDARYSSVPLDWYMTPKGWPERNAVYLTGALDVLEQAAGTALERAGLDVSAVDALVVASSTGIATPSLDALLMERMPFRRDTVRLPIFGLGCVGGVLGLARAAGLARAMPGRTILFLVVELCALQFRHGDLSKSNIVATALFGDGGAAAVLRADGQAGPAIAATGEHTWPGTLDIMGWRVETDGLGVVFAQSIPALVRNELRPAAEAFLATQGMELVDLAGVICHPGGAKVISALEEALSPCTQGFSDAWGVLRDYGNMSAATVLFVLERRLAAGAGGRHLMTALGPGFTAGFALIDL